MEIWEKKAIHRGRRSERLVFLVLSELLQEKVILGIIDRTRNAFGSPDFEIIKVDNSVLPLEVKSSQMEIGRHKWRYPDIPVVVVYPYWEISLKYRKLSEEEVKKDIKNVILTYLDDVRLVKKWAERKKEADIGKAEKRKKREEQKQKCKEKPEKHKKIAEERKQKRLIEENRRKKELGRGKEALRQSIAEILAVSPDLASAYGELLMKYQIHGEECKLGKTWLLRYRLIAVGINVSSVVRDARSLEEGRELVLNQLVSRLRDLLQT